VVDEEREERLNEKRDFDEQYLQTIESYNEAKANFDEIDVKLTDLTEERDELYDTIDDLEAADEETKAERK